MKIASIAFTENGAKIVKMLVHEMDVKGYVFEKYKTDGLETFNNVSSLVRDIFKKYNAIVFVGACVADLLDAVKFRGLVAWLPEYILKGYQLDGISIVELDEPGCYCNLYMTWCEGQLLQKPLAYEIREIVEEYFISRVNEYES